MKRVEHLHLKLNLLPKVLPFLLNVEFTELISQKQFKTFAFAESTNALTACVRPVVDINDTSVQRK